MLDIAALCLVATALVAYLNERFVRLPTTIGVMAIALVISLALVGSTSSASPGRPRQGRGAGAGDRLLRRAHAGMLSVLLFAGALHIDLSRCSRYRLQIGASRSSARGARPSSSASPRGSCCPGSA
jgi:CPA1 family monovalent cation:H+ antiporter